jgi:hypothetical protein
MGEEVFPVLTVPVPLAEKARNYTGYLVWLSISPRTDNGTLDLTASARVLAYRLLADGTIDAAPERLAKTFNLGSLVEAHKNGGTAFSRFIDQVVVAMREALKAV